MSDWIGVSEKLPELLVRVILFDANGLGAISGRRSSIGWYLEGTFDENANITHWMPLPEPPMEQKND